MFNLLMIKWHKMRVYMYQQKLDSWGLNDDVTVIDLFDLHYDYEKFLNTIYQQSVIGTIKKHCFTITSKSMENIIMHTKKS